jgi:hypothetical protein
VIAFGNRETDNIHGIIPIAKFNKTIFSDLGPSLFDYVNSLITLSMITLNVLITFLQTCQLSCWNSTPAIDAEWMSEQKFLIAEANGIISLDSVNPSKMRKVSNYFNIQGT